MPSFESQVLKQDCLQSSRLSYDEVVSFLNNHWKKPIAGTIQKINFLLGSLSSQLSFITIAGTSGKSTTIYYLTKLFETESLKVGTFTSPHFNFYNERIAINGKSISNDIFTHLANKIFEIIKTNNIPVTSKDFLVAMALLHFKNENVDLVVFEQEETIDYDPITICPPKILGITRIVLQNKELTEKAIKNILRPISQSTFVTSANQNKSILHNIAQQTKQVSNNWIMPIRKIAPLPYPYEQLHGRCAALAERIAQTYINQIINLSDLKTKSSLLRITKKQRGRPSLVSKKNTNYSNKTIEHFWKTTTIAIPHHFQKIEHSQYTILLDAASSIDAFQNLLLGIRLLNYEKPFKSVSFLLSSYHEQFCEQEFIKTVRYFFKKVSSQLILCPIENAIGEQTGVSADLEKFAILMQHAKIKVITYKNFKTAFELTTKKLHDPQDLFVITGSQAIISEYWKYKSNKNR